MKNERPPMTITVERPAYGRFNEIRAYIERPDGKIAIPTTVTKFTVCERDDPILDAPAQPVLELTDIDCQTLVDALWAAGFKPREGTGSTGQLAAVERHLEHTTKLLELTLQTTLNQANAATLMMANAKAPKP